MTLPELQQHSCRQVAALNVFYSIAFGAAVAWWMQWRGLELTPVNLLGCFAPALACIAMAFTSIEDTEQYIARIIACGMFLPVLALFWSSTPNPAETRMVWPGGVAFAVAHIACFVGSLFYFGTVTTRVPASPNTVPVPMETLRARLQAVAGGTAPFDMTAGEANEIVMSFRYAADSGRSHQARLILQPEHRAVQVKERLSAKAAQPLNEQERSMRVPGDPLFDPARPIATIISNTEARTSTMAPKRLGAVPVTLLGNSAELPQGYAMHLDGEGMITLLCAIVTRSGWNWQPVFFGD